jgi:hypothetical protein
VAVHEPKLRVRFSSELDDEPEYAVAHQKARKDDTVAVSSPMHKPKHEQEQRAFENGFVELRRMARLNVLAGSNVI